MRGNVTRAVRMLAHVSLALALTACAGFSGNTLPQVSELPPPLNPAARSLAVNLEFRQFFNGAPTTLLRQTAERGHRDRLVGTLEASGYFSSVSADAPDSDLVLSVKLRDEGSGSQGLAFLTGLTLYLVPSFATDTWIVDATLSRRGEEPDEEFHVEEFVTQWQHLFLVPLMPFKLTPVVTYKVHGNIWRTLAAEIGRSNLLQGDTGRPRASN